MRRASRVATPVALLVFVVGVSGASIGCFGTSGTADEIDDGGALDGATGDSTAGADTGTSTDSAIGPDSGTPTDTGPATDTGTAPADTAPADTAAADTATPTDTGTPPTDTGTTPTDTGTVPTDTGTTPTDTGTPPDTGPVAELSCSIASGPSSGTIELPSGTVDWAHWGLFAKDSWDHKSGGTYLTTKGTTKGGVGQYAGYPIGFTWASGGTPTPAMLVPSSTGIYVSNKDEGFDFDVVASASGETLVVWVARVNTGLTIKVTPSDAGLTTFNGDVPSTSGLTPATVTCKIRGATTTSKVSIQIRQTSNSSGSYGSLLSAVVKTG